NTKKVSQSPPFLLSKLIQIILTQPSPRITEHTHPGVIAFTHIHNPTECVTKIRLTVFDQLSFGN
ncbi:hypothetical protein, partial [uncultured Psychrobacter sp.]|uniref:hypothetical protein n=1 Tax=uncultured Psychrobacter sp. TaxID=259303 RepID=UPI0026282815